MKILLATDGSWCSMVAVREVAGRPWPRGTEVKLLHVSKQPVTHRQEQVDALPAKVRSHLYGSKFDALDKALAQFSSSERPDLSVDAEVRPGEPARVIVAEAERWGADLVVVGAHGMGRAERVLLGSVSRQVASKAKCSVEIVRAPVGSSRKTPAPK